MKPRFGVENLSISGNTAARSALDKPYHNASVAAYCSTDVVGIQRPRGLDPDARYAVYFEVDPTVYLMPGSQLMQNGVRVMLPTPYSSDVVHVERQ